MNVQVVEEEGKVFQVISLSEEIFRVKSKVTGKNRIEVWERISNERVIKEICRTSGYD